MRALNSGRRWGSDVPTMSDILRIVETLHEKMIDRSNVLKSICDRVEHVNTSFITVHELERICVDVWRYLSEYKLIH